MVAYPLLQVDSSVGGRITPDHVLPVEVISLLMVSVPENQTPVLLNIAGVCWNPIVVPGA